MREGGLLAQISPWEVGSRGTWRLDGDTIVTDEQPLYAAPGSPPLPRRVYRMKILEFRRNELIRAGNRSPFKRVK